MIGCPGADGQGAERNIGTSRPVRRPCEPARWPINPLRSSSMKTLLFASALLLATPVLAQTTVVEPRATGTVGTVQPGGPAIANSGPASTGEIAPGGSAA